MTGTSPYSGWVAERALLNRANKGVAEAIKDIRVSLPFPLTGGHYDNSMTFINKPLLEWCLAKHKSEQALPQERQWFRGTEKLRCGTQDGGILPV